MAVATQSKPTPAHELVYEAGQLPKLRSNYGDDLDADSVGWLKETLPDIMEREPLVDVEKAGVEGMAATKTSTFGEAEVDDITAW